MSNIKQKLAILALLAGPLFALGATANIAVSTPAVSGYDVVSYQSDSGPLRGEGTFVAEHDGITYLFASAENKETFLKNPAQYLPAYGGFCAMGVSLGKKFHVDPLAWKVVDGTLYLNLNRTIQKRWLEDVPGNIVKANSNWPNIENIPSAEL